MGKTMKNSCKKILVELRKNARESITNISKKTGIPTSTVFLKIKDCEENVVRKHTTLIDYAKLGFNHWQKTAIKLSDFQNRDFEKFLLAHPNVNSVYQINTGYDYLVETVHENVKEYMNFKKEMESQFRIEEKQEFQIINDLKRENFMTTIEEP
ncbi:Lrp/AsnC ligand binding domain-containing protein [archaeon]|nr:Lrp/AsnC ligand binding domain-containing protein [archaeon]MBL7057188.1 Lrp/AsnC ligand binding domain-containing protein [Candidatus Woesearchaeota archaeon]